MTINVTATVYTSYAASASSVAVLRYPSDLRFSTGPHGCDACTVRYRVPSNVALQMVTTGAVFHVVVSALGATVWSGRAENVSIVRDGVELVAYGYWRALLDQPYTALWSDTKNKNWIKPTGADISDSKTERFEFDTGTRLLIAPRKNELMGSAFIGYLYYKIPSGSSRQIVAVSFDYAFSGETSWQVGLQRRDSSLAFIANQWTSTGAGSAQSGTRTETFTACDSVALFLRYDAANANYAGETGVTGFSLTNVRVKTTTSSTVAPDAIVSDMISLAPAISSSAISVNGLDLRDESYEDKYPGDVIDYITSLGDASGNRWEAGVGADRVFYYRQLGTSSREWYADMLDLDFARSISEMWNSVYAVHKNFDGTTLRGTASTDANSVALWGLTRKLAMRNDTTSATTANYHRDVLLADKKNPVVKTKLDVSPVGVSDLWQIKSGDYINIRNLPPLNFGGVNFNRFRIERTEYDATNDTLTLESENPLTSLEFVLGRRDAGLDPRSQIIERDPRIVTPVGGFNRRGVDPNTGLIPIRY